MTKIKVGDRVLIVNVAEEDWNWRPLKEGWNVEARTSPCGEEDLPLGTTRVGEKMLVKLTRAGEYLILSIIEENYDYLTCSGGFKESGDRESVVAVYVDGGEEELSDWFRVVYGPNY